jgi:hypothetical protein
MIQRAWTHEVGVGARTSFLDDKLKLEAMALVDLSTLNGRNWRHGDVFAGGWYATPMVTYTVLDPLRVTAGANFFGGDPTTLLGSREGNSRAFALVRYGF